jgi:hypothetical protein
MKPIKARLTQIIKEYKQVHPASSAAFTIVDALIRNVEDLLEKFPFEELTDSYCQVVPDKCDRIVWNNRYYHLTKEKIVPFMTNAIKETKQTGFIGDSILELDLDKIPGEVLGQPFPDFPEWCTTFKERMAFQKGVAIARKIDKIKNCEKISEDNVPPKQPFPNQNWCVGCYLKGEAQGIPRYCNSCKRGVLFKEPFKVTCYICNKKVKATGLKDHKKDVHGV